MTNNETDNKLIHILSPITGMSFKIELTGNENCLRELLGTILEIHPSSIKGIKDSYNNYYTLSSALKSRIINTDPNNIYSIITENNINNKEYDLRRYSFNNNYNNYFPNKGLYTNANLYYFNNRYINDENLFFQNNRINNIQNIQNVGISNVRNNYIGNNIIKHYNIKDYYYLINLLYKNNYIDSKNYYKLKKCIDIDNQDVLEIMKPFIEYDDNYDKLINNLFPILNLDLTINDEFKYNKNMLGYDKYKHILNDLKEYFTSDNIKELNYLLLMENIDIVKIFKMYYETRNKKLLINSLYDLLKKYSKLNRRSKSNNIMKKIIKERKSKSQNYTKFSKKTNNNNNLNNKGNKKYNKELINNITNKIIEYGKQFTKDIHYLMKQELKNLSDEDKNTLFTSKFKLNLNNIKHNEFSLDNSTKKNIKNYYNKYIQNNIYKFFDEDEKKIYDNIIEESDSQEYQELMEIYSEMGKNNKSKNKMELLRNKIINYLKQFIEQNEEESDEEKQESKSKSKSKSKEKSKSKSKNKNSSKESEDEDDKVIKIEANGDEEDDEEQEDDNKNEKNEEKESSLVSSTVMDVEEDNNENYSEESGVSIRKANRPKKN